MLKGMPPPKGSTPKPKRGSVVAAIDALESRRKAKSAATAKPATAKPGDDLDLDFIR